MWKYTSFIKKGLSHEKNGADCQDSVVIRENDKCIVAALSDGLGSLENSAVASSCATAAVWDLFSSLGDKKIPYNEKSFKPDSFRNELVTKIKDMMLTKAQEMNIPEKSMDCTLVFVYVSKLHGYAITGRLGDSAICIIKDSGNIAICADSASANGTSAMLDKDSVEHMHIAFHKLEDNDIKGFILTSDGLDNEIYRKGSSHVSMTAEDYFNAPVLSDNPQKIIGNKINLLTSSPDSAFDDDISIAVLSRAESPISFAKDPTWLCRCNTRNRLQDTYCQNCHADFSVIYQDIRFREHGGKTAFFIELNKDPKKERKTIGLPETPLSPDQNAKKQNTPPADNAQQSKKNSSQDSSSAIEDEVLAAPKSSASFDYLERTVAPSVQMPSARPKNTSPAEKKPEPQKNAKKPVPQILIIGGIAGFIAGALLIGILSIIIFSSHNSTHHPHPKETEISNETTTIQDITVTNNEEENSESPSHNSSEPNSTEENTELPSIQIPIIDWSDADEPSSEEPTVVGNENKVILSRMTEIYEHPGKSNDLVATLKEGSEVYIINDDVEIVNGERWIQIRTKHGSTGWILEKNIAE